MPIAVKWLLHFIERSATSSQAVGHQTGAASLSLSASGVF